MKLLTYSKFHCTNSLGVRSVLEYQHGLYLETCRQLDERIQTSHFRNPITKIHHQFGLK